MVGQIKTVVDDAGLRMELKNALLFDSGQAEITPAGRAAIDKVVKLLPTIDQRYQIAIEGHTDDVPIHTVRFDSNWELSSGRAINVLKSFTAVGISAQRLSAQGYADTRPAAILQGDSASYASARQSRCAEPASTTNSDAAATGFQIARLAMKQSRMKQAV